MLHGCRHRMDGEAEEGRGGVHRGDTQVWGSMDGLDGAWTRQWVDTGRTGGARWGNNSRILSGQQVKAEARRAAVFHNLQKMVQTICNAIPTSLGVVA